MPDPIPLCDLQGHYTSLFSRPIQPLAPALARLDAWACMRAAQGQPGVLSVLSIPDIDTDELWLALQHMRTANTYQWAHITNGWLSAQQRRLCCVEWEGGLAHFMLPPAATAMRWALRGGPKLRLFGSDADNAAPHVEDHIVTVLSFDVLANRTEVPRAAWSETFLEMCAAFQKPQV